MILETTPRIAVCHLLWQGADIIHFKNFIDSYRRFPDPLPHDLIILFSGFEGGEDQAALEVLEGLSYLRRDYRDDGGYDIGPYLESADFFDHDFFFFMNSYSRILAPDWLTHVFNGFISRASVGVVGVSGSWESNVGDGNFPNYTIRTNAFFISSGNLAMLQKWEMSQKRDTNLFESGPSSMSQQLLEKGMHLLVVDKKGRVWEKEDWRESETFRSQEQKNLLIADNRTDDYQQGDKWMRQFLSNLAWSADDPGPNPFKQKKLSRRIRRFFRFLGVKQK
ncbi:MAG: hypothetical protein V7723_03230 [Sneathiella sp.]|uniref:hypothetical protein n=1 Tax=Sneathiella sp. TaxID=1964365 RepID=UPI003001F863